MRFPMCVCVYKYRVAAVHIHSCMHEFSSSLPPPFCSSIQLLQQRWGVAFLEKTRILDGVVEWRTVLIVAVVSKASGRAAKIVFKKETFLCVYVSLWFLCCSRFSSLVITTRRRKGGNRWFWAGLIHMSNTKEKPQANCNTNSNISLAHDFY